MSSEAPVEEGAARPSWLKRPWLWIRRHPWWTALIVLIVAVRVALPYALRPVLEDQISALLNGRIEIDDVDLSLLRGEAVVEGVRIYEAGDRDVVSFAKLLANVGWTALPFQQAVIEEIQLLSPKVQVVRQSDGEINLANLAAPAPAADVAAAPEAETAPDEAEEGGGWPAGLTRLTLEDATITFRDETVKNFQEVEFDIDLLQIDRAAYGGPIYEEDGKVTLVAELAGAPLKIEADFASEILSATSTGNFHLRDLDVGLGSPYTAQMLGWSDLRGILDVDFDFAAESGEAGSPRIALSLHDFSITVEGESEPALGWDSLEIAVQEADLQERFVRVSEVRLTNPLVRVRPAEKQPLVLLSRMDRDAAAADSPAAAAPPQELVGGEDGAGPGAAGDAAAPGDEPRAAEEQPGEATGSSAAPAPAEAVEEPETAKAADAVAAAPAPPAAEPAPGSAPAGTEAAAPPEPAQPPAEVAATDAAEPVAAAAAPEPAEPPVEVAAAADAVEPAAGQADAPAADEAGAAPEPVAEDAGDPARAAAEASPRWELDKLVIDGASILVEAPEKTLDVGVDVELTGLSSEPGDKANLVVNTALEEGTLDVAGEIGIAPVSFAGGIDLANLSLPAVLPVVPEPRAKIVRAGVARTDLELSVLVKEGEEAPAVDATVSGSLGLAGLQVADADPKRFSFQWDDLAIAVDGIDVRDNVPAADSGKAPVRIASVTLQKPTFRGVRLEDGSIALPAELTGDVAAEAAAEKAGAIADKTVDEVAHDVAAASAEAAAAAENAAEDAAAEPMPAVAVDKVRVTNGSMRIVDRAVRPEAKPGLKTFKLSLDGVRMPERQIRNLHFKGVGLRGGVLEAKGQLAGEATEITISIEKYRLVPYDPYAVTFSGYGIRRGMLSVESKVKLEGADFDTHTKVVVHQLGLKNTSGTTEFEDQIGVPVSLALALLKDTQGDIKLDVPVSGNAEETNIGIGGIVAQQLKRILINALTSPLKLFGALGGGDEVGDFSAARIQFAEGAPVLSAEGRSQAEQIAGLLRDRPDLAIHLDVRNSLGDVRAMQEAVLLAELRGRESSSDELVAIREYLEAKARGEEGDLPYYLEPILEEMLSHRKPPKEEIATLSTSRVEVVRNLMTGELGVRPDQVIVEEEHLTGGVVDGPAVVEAELGVVEGEDDYVEEDEAAQGDPAAS